MALILDEEGGVRKPGKGRKRGWAGKPSASDEIWHLFKDRGRKTLWLPCRWDWASANLVESLEQSLDVGGVAHRPKGPGPHASAEPVISWGLPGLTPLLSAGCAPQSTGKVFLPALGEYTCGCSRPGISTLVTAIRTRWCWCKNGKEVSAID